MKSFGRMFAVAGVAALMIVALAAPGGAGKFVGNMVTVEKEVVGPVPPGTVFTVELDCTTEVTLPTATGVEPIEITFDAAGNPTSQNEFDVPASASCTATETGTGGAKTVAYACEATGTRATCPGGATVPTVQFVDVTGSEGVLTVTNTFVAAPPVIEPAVEVVVPPAFTG